MSPFLRKNSVLVLLAWAMILSAGALRADPPDDQFAVAAGHYDRGRWKLAAEEFRVFLQKYPNDRRAGESVFFLGEALLQSGSFDEARRQFILYTGRQPEGKRIKAALFRLGEAAYLARDFDKAVPDLQRFLTKYPDDRLDAFILFYLGDIQLSRGRPADAVRQFDAALAVKSADEALVQQALHGNVRAARGLIERKQYAEAAALLESLIGRNRAGRLSPQDLENRYLLAVSYEGLRRYEEALATLLPVVDNATGPLKADAQLTQGSLLLALKKYADAIAPLETFLAGKPTGDAQAKALAQLAICSAHARQVDKAKRLYSELIAKHPQNRLVPPTTEHLANLAYEAGDAAWAADLSARLAASGVSTEYAIKGKLGLGWSQFQAGRLAESAATFDDVLKKNPPEAVAAEAALARGQILAMLGQSEPALAMFDLAIARYPRSPQHADSLLAAARLYDKLKQPDRSAALYERLDREHPQFPKLDLVLYDWAWALRALGKAQDADRLFERLRRQYPQSRFRADATFRLAQRAFDAQDFARAIGLIDDALVAKADPQVREYAMHLRGQIAVAKADWPKAREVFETLVAEFPESRRRLAAEYWSAESCYRQGDYQAAAARLERVAQQIEQLKDHREPWMAMVPLRRAQMFVKQGQFRDAYAIAAKIAADYPRFEQQYEVDYVLGRCLANEADFEGARKAYNRVIGSAAGAKTETAAMAQWMIGETYFHQKDYRTALREYLRLETLYAYPNWQAAALLEAGKCHQRLGEPTPAAELYRQILKDYPKTSFAQQAAKQLAAIGKPMP
jgi:cellulose synthase operon protein C